MPRARELAARALELDPDLPEAHAMLGIIAGHYDYDWREAERRFQLATARDQQAPHLRHWYASFWLMSTGRLDEAARQSRRVIDEDPLCQMWHAMDANILAARGRMDEALAAAKTAVALDPQFWFGWQQLGQVLAVRGEHDAAMPWIEKAMGAAPWCPYNSGLMAGLLARRGDVAAAEPLLATLRAHAFAGGIGMVCYFAMTGDLDRAAEWVGKAAEHRFPVFIPVWIRSMEPLLRQAARWPAALAAMNLEPAGN
jgi:tetratricopeptide (TPR) repeat protein